MDKIGLRIKECREALGMSQEELAEKMGYKSRSSITKIEKGVNDISQTKVKQFADVLHTSFAYLMGWDTNIINDYVVMQQEVSDNHDSLMLFVEMGLNKNEIERLAEYAKFLISQRGNDNE